MSTINEEIVTGRKFRKLIDEANKIWQRISFWTKASDVEFNDSQTAETKMGAISGITSDLNGESENIAASIKAVNQLNNNLISDIYVGTDGKLHKVQGGADAVLPFSKDFKEMLYLSVNSSGGGCRTFDFETGKRFDMVYGGSSVYFKTTYQDRNNYKVYAKQNIDIKILQPSNVVEKHCLSNELIVNATPSSPCTCWIFVK